MYDSSSCSFKHLNVIKFYTSQLESVSKTARCCVSCNLTTAFCHLASTGSLVLQYADRNTILSRTETLLLVLLSDILRPFWRNLLLRAPSANNRVVKRNPKFLVYSWRSRIRGIKLCFTALKLDWFQHGNHYRNGNHFGNYPRAADCNSLIGNPVLRFQAAFAWLRKAIVRFVMSARPSILPPVYPSVRPSVRLPVCPSVLLSVRPSVCPSVCLSARLSVRLSPSVCPSACLSTYSHSAPTVRIVMKYVTWNFFENLSRKFKFD
jgi:hypothetical protein